MNKTIVIAGAALGLTGVALGALGAHALREQLEPVALESFQTGVRYQMYHALFLLFLGVERTLGEGTRKWIFRFILGGTLCFSFSIYLLSTSGITGWDFSSIGWVTPVGGVLLLTGWGLLLYRVFRLTGR
ncbi:DUF423 domain-containing protein [Robiginitalea biformata]|uniref:DUF423 domain-containing protein n=1 Tax=Robiginitalea biformata TaxID=252307 RepID=UPI003B5947C6